MCQDCVRIKSGSCQDFVKIVWRLCQDCIRIFSDMCQDCARSVPELCQDCITIVLELCQDYEEFFQDYMSPVVSGLCQVFVTIVSEEFHVCVRLVSGWSGWECVTILSGLCQDC